MAGEDFDAGFGDSKCFGEEGDELFVDFAFLWDSPNSDAQDVLFKPDDLIFGGVGSDFDL